MHTVVRTSLAVLALSLGLTCPAFAGQAMEAQLALELGDMHYFGEGLPVDYAVAIKWYRKAAEQGTTSAQFNLGLMYYNGQGVPQDYVQAHKWFNLAAANAAETKERESAVKGRDAIAAKMTPAQIAEAQKLAREWKPSK